jgi:hypothetical protein
MTLRATALAAVLVGLLPAVAGAKCFGDPTQLVSACAVGQEMDASGACVSVTG